MKKVNTKISILLSSILFIVSCGSSDTASTINTSALNNGTSGTNLNCTQQGGQQLADSVCKFVYQYLLIGSGSGIYWANGSYMPLIKPSTSDEINGITSPPAPIERQNASVLQKVEAKDLVTFSGNPEEGVEKYDFFTGPYCGERHAVSMVVDDGHLAYPLTQGTYTQIQNTGTLRAGFNKNANQDWSDNCIQAKNNSPVYVTVLHCVKNGETVVCP